MAVKSGVRAGGIKLHSVEALFNTRERRLRRKVRIIVNVHRFLRIDAFDHDGAEVLAAALGAEHVEYGTLGEPGVEELLKTTMFMLL